MKSTNAKTKTAKSAKLAKRTRTDGSKYNGVKLPEDATQRRRMRNKLSAQVHRKRKADALNTAKEEVECCDNETNKLKEQLDNTRSKVSSLQAIMDAIQLQFGAEAIQHILENCNQTAGTASPEADCPTVRSVTSDSDMASSSDEDSSIACIKEVAAI